MEPVKKSGLNTFIVWLFVLSFLAVIVANFDHFFFKKSYDYLVEASCDPQIENCYYRDCQNAPDECPPNGLSVYKVYTIGAKDFHQCSNNSCKTECESSIVSCISVACDEGAGDICSPVE